MKSRVFPVIRKELIHIIRDPRSLAIIFLLPIIMVLLFGFAITFDVKDIKLAVLDECNTADSRNLVLKFTNNNYMKVVEFLQNRDSIESLMMKRDVVAVVIVPMDFSENLGSGRNAQIQVLVDGSNANSATIVMNYINAALNMFQSDLYTGAMQAPIIIEPRVWYNPDLNSTHFIVPGLLAVLMMMICAMLTSITIAREKETGTMEQILVSPVKAYEIIIGKVIPYILVAFLVSASVLVFSILVFGVPFKGSVILLTLLSLVFIYASLSLGVFISSKARTQQIALMISLVGTLLPSILLSGFIFPIFAIPKFLQFISHIVPAKYYLVIVRGILLKGIGIEYLYKPVISLFIIGTVLIAISIQNFKTNLEG